MRPNQNNTPGEATLNKKKAIILYGSPHENGNTKTALEKVLTELNDEYNFKFVDAYKENIRPCIDCSFCVKSGGKCIFRDFDDIDMALREADLIILATPIYNASFPAPLKAIIDRTQLYFNMKTKLKINPFKQEKSAILIASYGSNDTSCEELILRQLRLFFVLLNAKLKKTIFVQGTDFKTGN